MPKPLFKARDPEFYKELHGNIMAALEALEEIQRLLERHERELFLIAKPILDKCKEEAGKAQAKLNRLIDEANAPIN